MAFSGLVFITGLVFIWLKPEMAILNLNVSISIRQWPIRGSDSRGMWSRRRVDCCVSLCRHEVCWWVPLCTQRNLLSGVGGEQEDQQGQAGDEHAGYEKVEAVVERPAAHRHSVRHIRVGLLTAVVVQLVTLCRHSWNTNEEKCQNPRCLTGEISPALSSILKNVKRSILYCWTTYLRKNIYDHKGTF